MRHQKRGYKLGRTPSHRKATLAALSNALIQHKQITTTWVKAKALRSFVEPIINRAKEDSTNNRRQVFRVLQDKESVKELFGEIAEKIDNREGGYTRIVKAGHRKGDGAEMAVIELVDYNDVKPEGASGTTKKRTRRAGRRRKSSDETVTVATAAPAAVEATEEIVEEAVEVTEESVSEGAEESSEAAESVIETATETVEEVVEEIKDVADTAVEKVAEVAESASEVVEDVVEEVVGSDEAKETSDGEEASEDEEKKEGE